MTIQFTLVLISFLLVLMIGLLVWVIKLVVQRKKVAAESAAESIVENTKLKTANKQIIQPKYANSKLKEEEKERFQEELILYLEMEKAYRQSDLSVAKLAKQINIPKQYLSQIINEKMNCSFLDFINRYRVEEAKDKLQAAEFQDLGILEIGKLVGFKAKSTFYTAFKKYTDSTPGDFRKGQQKINSQI